MNDEFKAASFNVSCTGCGRKAYLLASDIGWQIKHQAGCPVGMADLKESRQRDRSGNIFIFVVCVIFAVVFFGAFWWFQP